MTNEQRKQVADLIAALDKIPPDVLDEFGEYPPHDAAADALGVKVYGTRASSFGDVRLGLIANARDALKAMQARLEAQEEALLWLRGELDDECNQAYDDDRSSDGAQADYRRMRCDAALEGASWGDDTAPEAIKSMAAMFDRLEALERVGAAVKHYRDCLEINELGAYKHGIGALEAAERDLDAALAKLENRGGE